MLSRDRNGNTVETFDGQGGIIRFLYGCVFGAPLRGILTAKWVSRAAGAFLSSRFSKVFVPSFVKKNRIELSDYEKSSFLSYNDFFIRRIKPEKRPFAKGSGILPSPCDAKLSICRIESDSRFLIKGQKYTAAQLLRDESLADSFCGGTLMLFRLTVDDYHRYCYPFDGIQGDTVHIDGKYHTVNPAAAAARGIYRENTREYTLVDTQLFGRVIMMEVGAMMVGRIVNAEPAAHPVLCGREKGYFEFGGSTVILMFEKGAAVPDEDIVKNSREGFETVVRMGERVGISAASVG